MNYAAADRAEASRRVLAVGAVAEEAAHEVARRRGATVVPVASVAEMAGHVGGGRSGAAFAIADADVTGPRELLQVTRAATSSPDLALGFLYGRGAKQLLAAAKRLPEQAPVAPAGSPQNLFAAADQPATLQAARIAFRNPETTPREVVARRLLEPSELTFLVGHGNAQHMTVGGAVLCRRSAVSANEDELRVYPCFHGEPCHFGDNRDEAEVNIDRLVARRLIALSCYGASFIEVPFPASFSVGEGLLRYAQVETLVTPVRAATIGSPDLAVVYYLINSGLPLGVVTNRANRFRIACSQHVEWVCFGDPESRVEASLETVSCRRAGDQIVMDPGKDNGRARDLVAAMPPGTLPATPIILDESSGDLLAAAVDGNGSLYASVPGNWKERPVRLRIVDRDELIDKDGTARRLLADLRFLDLYLPYVARSHPESTALAAVTEAKSNLQALLHGWPVDECPAYSRLEASQLRALWRDLRGLVETLTSKFMLLYLELMTPDQRTHPTPWDALFRTIGSKETGASCAYCGSKTDEFEMQARLGDARRQWGLCRDACAYVWDGDPGLDRWLELPQRFVAGEENVFAITPHNPYGIALDGFAVGVLKHFKVRSSLLGVIARAEVAPGESRRVELRIVLPEELRPGLYYLCACLMLGTRFNFYRTHVVVTPPSKFGRASQAQERRALAGET